LRTVFIVAICADAAPQNASGNPSNGWRDGESENGRDRPDGSIPAAFRPGAPQAITALRWPAAEGSRNGPVGDGGNFGPEKPQRMTALLYVLNGPNLNMLGSREPGIYGATTLAGIEDLCRQTAAALDLEARCHQSNHEGALVDLLHEAHHAGAVGVVLNGGAYTHTSVALLDAVRAIAVPVIEVHLSNIHAREPFRHHSYPAQAARGVIAGLGPMGYALAIQALASDRDLAAPSPDLRTA